MTNEISEKLVEHFQILGFSLILCSMTSYLAYKLGFFELKHIRHFPIKGWQVLLAFVSFIGFQALIIPALIVVIHSVFLGSTPNFAQMNIETRGWINIFTLFGGAFGVLLTFLTLKKELRQMIWGHSSHWIHDIIEGFLAWLVSYPFAIIMGQLVAIVVLFFSEQVSVDQVAVREFKQILSYPVLFMFMSFSVAIIVPCTEELLFRGYLQSWIKTKIKNTYISIIITSVIFALFHFSPSQKLTNIELTVSLFILSCFLGFMYEKKKSLWAPIGLHAAFNGISILMILVDR